MNGLGTGTRAVVQVLQIQVEIPGTGDQRGNCCWTDYVLHETFTVAALEDAVGDLQLHERVPC